MPDTGRLLQRLYASGNSSKHQLVHTKDHRDVIFVTSRLSDCSGSITLDVN